MRPQIQAGNNNESPVDKQDQRQVAGSDPAQERVENKAHGRGPNHVAAGEGIAFFFRQVRARSVALDQVLDDIAGSIGYAQGQQDPQPQFVIALVDQNAGNQDVPDDDELWFVNKSDDLPKNVLLRLDQPLVQALIEAVEGRRIKDAQDQEDQNDPGNTQ